MVIEKKHRIILVCGLPGSGKSYFASRLAEKLGAEYVNSDRIRKQLFPRRSYSESEKATVYAALLRKMEKSINDKSALVLDATFHKSSARKPFLSKANNHIYFIEVQADEAVVKERLKKNRPYSEADFGVYELIKKEWEPLNPPYLILQSTNNNIDLMLKKALQYLKNDTRTN